MSARTRIQDSGRLISPTLLFFLVSLLLASATASAQDNSKTYVSPKFGFTFQYPAVYDLKVIADRYVDFNRDGKTRFGLRVDDRFIEMLYQMFHPGPVIYRRGEEDPRWGLARETRQNKDLFRLYARQEAKNWCDADGPDGSVYCQEIKSERPFISRYGIDYSEYYLLMTREDFTNNTKQQEVVGPVFAVYLPREEDLPLIIMITPAHGKLAPPALINEVQEVIDSLMLTPQAR